MKKWLAWLLPVIYLAFCPVAGAEPQVPPAPTTSIYAQDQAGVLSAATVNRINSLSGKLAAKTKAQVVVLTVKTLAGTPVDEYALTVLRQWGIGDKTLNNGVLILVAVDDRQSRIEVGYGLEGALPDAKTGRIQDDYMLPYFKNGDYDQGILNGYLAVVGVVAGEYNLELKTDSKPAPTGHRPATESGWSNLPGWLQAVIVAGFLLLAVVDWLFFGGAITLFLLSLLRFRGGGGGGGSGGGGFGGGSGGGGGSSRNW